MIIFEQLVVAFSGEQLGLRFRVAWGAEDCLAKPPRVKLEECLEGAPVCFKALKRPGGLWVSSSSSNINSALVWGAGGFLARLPWGETRQEACLVRLARPLVLLGGYSIPRHLELA